MGGKMKQITEQEFILLVSYIKEAYGVDLYRKKTLVVGRLQNYLTENKFNNFTDYYKHVISDKTGNAATILINKLTTNHTYFMREPQHFEFFKKKVLPNLERTEYRKKDIGIWSAGCSTGEEPYTLAMIIADYFGTSNSLWDTKILATDISTRVLETARRGIYTNEEISRLPQNWKINYFKTKGNSSMVDEKIRNEVIYRKLNLIQESFPFKRKFHVIFCRNVMIYFDAETKKQLINRFYECTEDGGYLFLGHSESINREQTKYKYIMPAIFRKV